MLGIVAKQKPFRDYRNTVLSAKSQNAFTFLFLALSLVIAMTIMTHVLTVAV